MSYTIIRDTREKKDCGWIFRQSEYCDGTEIKKLDTGDYAIKGYEDFFVIERKGSITEFVQNIVEVRFEKELQRLESVKFPFILLEFELNDIMKFPIGARIPKYKMKYVKIKPAFILKRLCEFQFQYKTKFILCGNSGKDMAISLFKRFMELVNDKRS